MGAREGTRPEDDPITRSISRQAVERRKEKGRREATAANVLAVLRARGIEVTPALAQDQDLFAALPGDELITAAVECQDQADFRRRFRNVAR